jgi:hypothetical protein
LRLILPRRRLCLPSGRGLGLIYFHARLRLCRFFSKRIQKHPGRAERIGLFNRLAFRCPIFLGHGNGFLYKYCSATHSKAYTRETAA